MGYFAIYFSGAILIIIMLFLMNRFMDDVNIGFADAILVSIFSWFSVIIILLLLVMRSISVLSKSKLDKWFRGE